jgi:acyl-CoA synthetase (AMP-forming)/AMP-acid ligase II
MPASSRPGAATGDPACPRRTGIDEENHQVSEPLWGDRMPGAQWFPGCELNFAENLLKRRDDAPAIIFRGENGTRRELSWGQLWDQVARLAASLAADGVGQGDRVGAYLPNAPEAVIGMLATSSLGAVWSSCSPDFGISGVLDRFGQIEPKVLLTVDGYHYAGKRIDIRRKVAEIAAALPSLRRTVVHPFLEAAPTSPASAPPCPSPTTWRPGRPTSPSPGSPSTTRSTSSTPRARRASPKPSSTASAARCSSTSRSTGCTPTSVPATGCSTSPPAAG